MKDIDSPEQIPGIFGPSGGGSEPATYCRRRFDSSGRMRRLKRLELDFASSIMELLGTEVFVLDAPCGSGRFFEVFAQAKQLALVDLNPQMLETLRNDHRGQGPLNLIQADVSELPFADNSFDLCFCMRLFHHLGDDLLRRKILAELTRVCRKFLALSFYKTHSLRYLKRVIRGKKPSGHSLSPFRFMALAEEVGLKLVRSFPALSLVEQQQMVLFEKK